MIFPETFLLILLQTRNAYRSRMDEFQRNTTICKVHANHQMK